MVELRIAELFGAMLLLHFWGSEYDPPPKIMRPVLSDLNTIEARRICVIKPSALGDVVQSMPLLGVLRSRFPDAQISWIINRELSELLLGHSTGVELIPFDRRGGWSGAARLARSIWRQRPFDLTLDLQGLMRTGLMTAATSAPIRVGLETAREGANLACNLVLPDTGPELAAHARYWRIAESLGVGHLPRRFEMGVPDAARIWWRNVESRLPRPLVGVQPGARWATKRWPAEKLAEVARRTHRLYGGSVVVLGTAGEKPLGQIVTEHLQSAGIAALDLCGATTLKQLAALLADLDLLLCNDSGPMHLAAELGTRVAGVFTCTSPRISGPAGAGHECIATALPCAAGYHKLCPRTGNGHLECFDEVTVDRVWQAVQRSLDRVAAA